MRPGSNLVVKLRDDRKNLPAFPPEFKAVNTRLVEQMLNVVLLRAPDLAYSCQEVCQAAKNLGDVNGHKELYALVMAKFQLRAEVTLQAVASRANGDESRTLEALVREWLLYRHDATHVALVLVWLDSRYVCQQTADRSIFAMAVRMLHEASKQPPFDGIVPRALDGFVEAVNLERRGDIVTRSHFSACRELVTAFGLYFSLMEPLLLRATDEHYTALVAKLVIEDNCSAEEFFTTVQKIQVGEKERSMVFMDSRSRGKFDECLQKALLLEHGVPVITAGFKGLAMNPAKRSEVRLATRLLSQKHVARGETVRMIFRQYVVDTGTEIVQGARDQDDSLIKALLGMKDAVEELVRVAFDDAETYRLAMREAFETFIRLKQNRVAELLAKHLDGLLRLGQKEVADPDMDGALDKAMLLFNYIPAKDIFEAFYWKDLARRLVFQRCASLELERRVIGRLKVISGTSVTMKLEGMLKDMATSEGIATLFGEYWEQQRATAADSGSGGSLALSAASDVLLATVSASGSYFYDPAGSSDGLLLGTEGSLSGMLREASSHPAAALEPRVVVLTRGYWPTYEMPDLALSPDLAHVQRTFNAFYTSKFNGRRLAWLHLLSTCAVKAVFPRGKKELQVSLLQALVLTHFNNALAASAARAAAASSDGDSGVTASPAAAADPIALSVNDLARLLRVQPDSAPQQQELFCAVMSLAAGSQAVLRRQNAPPPVGAAAAAAAPGAGPKLSPADRLVFNDAFTHKFAKIRMLQIVPKEVVQEESTATSERVFSERQYVVDAAIVRFMKSRRKVSHSELVAELPTMLKFPVAVPDLKKRLETLIDRDFIQRSPQDNTIYEYRA